MRNYSQPPGCAYHFIIFSCGRLRSLLPHTGAQASGGVLSALIGRPDAKCLQILRLFPRQTTRMPIHLHPLSNEIGVIALSHQRYLAIAQALNEPCVWLNRGNAADLERSYEVVIIDANAALAGTERRHTTRDQAADPMSEQPLNSDPNATWRQPGLVVFQCLDGKD
jgi:hypothetical protein